MGRGGKKPKVWKYRDMEYHFGTDGCVRFIYRIDGDGTRTLIAGA